jgi:hypothetical protein
MEGIRGTQGGGVGSVRWVSPHNPEIQPHWQFRNKCWASPVVPSGISRQLLSHAAVVMVGPDGSFLAREILAGYYSRQIFWMNPDVVKQAFLPDSVHHPVHQLSLRDRVWQTEQARIAFSPSKLPAFRQVNKGLNEANKSSRDSLR